MFDDSDLAISVPGKNARCCQCEGGVSAEVKIGNKHYCGYHAIFVRKDWKQILDPIKRVAERTGWTPPTDKESRPYFS